MRNACSPNGQHRRHHHGIPIHKPHEENQEEIVKVLYRELINVYSELGFEISPAKTIISTNKGTFLNILFVDGSEVALPLKTAMRIFRAVHKRFSETADIVEIFNEARWQKEAA